MCEPTSQPASASCSSCAQDRPRTSRSGPPPCSMPGQSSGFPASTRSVTTKTVATISSDERMGNASSRTDANPSSNVIATVGPDGWAATADVERDAPVPAAGDELELLDELRRRHGERHVPRLADGVVAEHDRAVRTSPRTRPTAVAHHSLLVPVRRRRRTDGNPHAERPRLRAGWWNLRTGFAGRSGCRRFHPRGDERHARPSRARQRRQLRRGARGSRRTPEVVTRLLDDHAAGREDNGRKLWALLVFSLWFARYGDASA